MLQGVIHDQHVSNALPPQCVFDGIVDFIQAIAIADQLAQLQPALAIVFNQPGKYVADLIMLKICEERLNLRSAWSYSAT